MLGRLGWLMAGLLLAAQAQAAAWVPTAREPFDVQLVTPFHLERRLGFVALGLFETSPTRVQELKARGIRTVCVINAGAWENWRPDSGAFDQRLIGTSVNGWARERWLDIRAREALGPILARRLDLCRSKGFDGVLLRNVDGYTHRTGFPLTANDHLAFIRWLAGEARQRDLAVGLMNALDLAPELAGDVDFALSEGCFEARSCERMRPYQAAGKAAFVIEYTNVRRKMDAYCADAADLDLQLIFKPMSLNGKVHRRCPP
jgi:hypothetical protein